MNQGDERSKNVALDPPPLKEIPKRFQIDSKEIQMRFQRYSKEIPTKFLRDSKDIPNRFQRDPKKIPKRFQFTTSHISGFDRFLFDYSTIVLNRIN